MQRYRDAVAYGSLGGSLAVISRGVFWGLLGTVLLSPLPFGSILPWAYTLLAVIVAVLVLVWSVTIVIAGDPPPVTLGMIRLPALLFFGVIVWAAIQAAPWTPAAWHNPVWAETAAILGTSVQGYISVQPHATETSIMRLLTYAYSFALNHVWNLAKSLLLSAKQKELKTEYAVSVGPTTSYNVELATKLLERLYRFTASRSVRLVIADIPQTGEEGSIRSSVPRTMTGIFLNNSDVFLDSSVIFDGAEGADLHVRHGHRHLSEKGHRILGTAIAESILRVRGGNLHPVPPRRGSGQN